MDDPGEQYLGVLRRAFAIHYGEGSDVWTGDPLARSFPGFVLSHVTLGPESRVLDVGCGAGPDVEVFAAVAGHVHGLDLHPHPAWEAVRSRHPNTAFTCADFLDFAPEAPFDLVFDSGCFHHQHPDRLGQYLRFVGALLAPGGVFAVNTFHDPDRAGFTDAHGRLHHVFSDDELAELLSLAGLRVFAQTTVARDRAPAFLRFTLARR